MTTEILMTLIAFSLLKGGIFGALFAWLFPPLYRYILARAGRDAGPLAHVPFGGRHYCGLAILSGAGFALVDLIDRVGETAGLPGLLRWAVIGLFGLSAFGTVLIQAAMPRPQSAQSLSDLGGNISCIAEVVCAFGWAYGADEPCDLVMDGIDAASLGHAQPMLDLGEHLLDRVEVRRIGRQEREPGAGCEDCTAWSPMAAEVVENDDVSRAKHRHRNCST
jgi:hypothetical protein